MVVGADGTEGISMSRANLRVATDNGEPVAPSWRERVPWRRVALAVVIVVGGISAVIYAQTSDSMMLHFVMIAAIWCGLATALRWMRTPSIPEGDGVQVVHHVHHVRRSWW
jgi:hypothetical protein